MSRLPRFFSFCWEYPQHSAVWWIGLPYKREKCFAIYCWLATGYCSLQAHTFLATGSTALLKTLHKWMWLWLYTPVSVSIYLPHFVTSPATVFRLKCVCNCIKEYVQNHITEESTSPFEHKNGCIYNCSTRILRILPVTACSLFLLSVSIFKSVTLPLQYCNCLDMEYGHLYRWAQRTTQLPPRDAIC